MTLEELQELTDKKLKINDTELDLEALKTPQLHNEFLKHYNFKITPQKLENVFVKDKSTGNIKKVNFGDKTMRIKKNIPARKRSFMARMGGVLKKVKGQKNLSPAYWAIKSWR